MNGLISPAVNVGGMAECRNLGAVEAKRPKENYAYPPIVVSPQSLAALVHQPPDSIPPI